MVEAVGRYIARERQGVERQLRAFFASRRLGVRRGRFSADLFASLERTTLRGTHKRLRPLLCVLAYDLAGGPPAGEARSPRSEAGPKGGRDRRVAREAGVMLELLHRSLLIHDDVMDRDTLRHGQLTVHEHFRRRFRPLGPARAEHLGTSFGMLVGDLAIDLCLDALADLPIWTQTRQSILRILVSAIRQTIEGQVDELELSHRSRVAPTDVDAVIESKSVHYTFLAPLRVGATLAAARPAVRKSLEAYGEHVGRAFQIQDDLLDIFGTTAVIGKPVGSDLREGKRTWVFLEAVRRAAPSDRRFLNGVVGRDTLSQPVLRRVRSILRRSGAVRQAQGEIERHVTAGIKALRRLNRPPALPRLVLETLANDQRNRVY